MRAWRANDVAGSPSGRPDGASRTRTGDLLGAIQALFQLSYSPAAAHLGRDPDATGDLLLKLFVTLADTAQ